MRVSAKTGSALPGILFGLAVLAFLPAGLGAQVTAGSPAGWTLQALEAADMDAIAQALGVRAGVMIVAIQTGSPAQQAGCIQGEVVLALNGTLADSPQALEMLVMAATGPSELVGFVIGADGNLQVVKRSIDLTRRQVQTQGVPATNPLSALRQALGTTPATSAQAGAAGGLAGTPGAPTIIGSPGAAGTGLAGPGFVGAGTGAARGSANDLSRGGSTWQHPVGFSFWYPASFTVKDADGGIQLVPAAQAGQAGQIQGGQAPQNEMYFLTAESIQGSGISSPFDQKVIAYLDNLVATKVSPYLARSTQPAKVSMAGGEGMFAEWSAAGSGGVTVVTRIYTTIMREFAVFLVSVGDRQIVDGKTEELMAIIRSIALGAGKMDQSIAGAWKLYSTRQIRNEDTYNFTTDDPRRADMVSDEQTSLELFPDGSARRTSVWRTIARGGSSGGSSTIWLDSGDQKSVKQGRWNADTGTLFIMWQNGDMEQWQYALVGASLKLAGSGKVQFWQR